MRKIKREQLRKRFGNKNLQEQWRIYQINKYGKDYERVCIDNDDL